MHPVRLFASAAAGEKGGRPQTSRDQETQQWRARDHLAAAALFLATASFVCWQNSRVAVLWDLGYLLDTSWRIALGQVPYRDFPFVHPPLTFLIQAGLIRLASRHYLLSVAYVAIAGGLGTVLAWRILLRVLRDSALAGGKGWAVALLLAAPLTVLGIYSVYPHPIYDCDCTLAILFALFLLIRVESPEKTARTRWILGVSAGTATVLPLFFKQNMGLPFLAVVAGAMVILLGMEWARTRSVRAGFRSQPGLVLAGMAVALLAALALVAGTAGLGNYLHWTVQFAAQRRFPGLIIMLADYRQPSFAWTVPTLGAGLVLCYSRFRAHAWARITAACLVAAPFAGAIVLLFVQDDADERADNLLALWPLLLLAALVIALFELRRGITLGRLIPFFILAAIHGAFLSQQLWGSTYAVWPLLMLLVAYVLAALPVQALAVAMAAAAVVSTTFLICGGLYAASLDRLSYVQIPDAPIEHSSIPPLRGMADPGPFLANFDELVNFTAREIPPNDALLLLPGEDPFYYATGRTPQFPVTLFDRTTDPYTASGLLAEAGRRNVRWVIVKHVLQINADPLPESERTLQLVQQDFAIYRRLKGYDVYRRR